MNLTPEGPESDTRVVLAREPDFRLGVADVRPSVLELVIDRERGLLEHRVMQVLAALARHAGSIVSRDLLSETCWQGRAVSEDALNRCIARLRRMSSTPAVRSR